MPNVKPERVERFHVRQVWESPRGGLYKVMSVVKGGKAILRLGTDGAGKKRERDWDDVADWVLHKDAPEIVLTVTAEPLEDLNAELLTFTKQANGEIDGFMTLSHKDRIMCMGHANPRSASKVTRPPDKEYKGRDWQGQMRKDAMAFYAKTFCHDPDAIVFHA